MTKCEPCNGTGYEICDNPDHAFGDAIGWRGNNAPGQGCPLCGWDDEHRILSSECTECSGTGEV